MVRKKAILTTFEIFLIALVGFLAILAYNLFASIQTENILVKIISHEKSQEQDFYLLASFGNDYVRYKNLSFYNITLLDYCIYSSFGSVAGDWNYSVECDIDRNGSVDIFDITAITSDPTLSSKLVYKLPGAYEDLQNYYIGPTGSSQFPIPYAVTPLYYFKYPKLSNFTLDQSFCIGQEKVFIPGIYSDILYIYDPFLKNRTCTVGLLERVRQI